jgi:1-acyl-sn-glycerol-3-phosphate acyltransferase
MTERPLLSRVWYEGWRKVVLAVGGVLFRLRYSGQENVPLEGPVILAANHQSYLDPPLIGAGCPRRINYLARIGLFRFAPFAWLIRSFDAIPIDQESGGLAGLKETLRRLKRGEAVLLFPEGSRSPDGQIQPFEPGFTALAYRSRAAIVPTAIEGAFDAWPRYRRFPRPGVVHVHFGAPVLPQDYARCDERELVARVEAEVRRLHAELRNRPVFRKRGRRAEWGVATPFSAGKERG